MSSEKKLVREEHNLPLYMSNIIIITYFNHDARPYGFL